MKLLFALFVFSTLVAVGVFAALQFLLPSQIKAISTNKSESEYQQETNTPLAIGRHFMIGHWADTPVASTTALILDHELAGVIIMSAPENPEDIKTWTRQWQEASPYPLMIAIDQEGGEVSRLRGAGFDIISQHEITTESQAYTIGKKRGNELVDLGINMNFAPVLDTARNRDAFLYQRVFPQDAVILATALARGHNEAGVDAVAKHFPGHPDSTQDSHTTLPTVPIDNSERTNFILPFATYIKNAKPKALMTAHVSFPNIDPLPATLSSYWLKTILRDELNYEGLVITDDMSMNAIDETWTSTEASRLALLAGADIILYAARPQDITNTLIALNAKDFDLQESDKRIIKYID